VDGELVDTIIAKIATKQLEATEGGLGDDTLADIKDDEIVITPPDSLGQYTYLCQTTPAVTHDGLSARAIGKQSVEPDDEVATQPGYSRLIHK
jgi:hypothetical protein